jgi:hypothetical protein
VTDDVPAGRAGPKRARLARSAGTASLALGAGVIGVSCAAILGFSEEVQILARRHGPIEEAEARANRDPRDPVAEIYGIPEREGTPVRVVFPPAARRIEPPEAPGAVLLFVDRARGEAPLLARTLAAVGGAGGVLLLVAGAALRFGARRGATANPGGRG